MFGRRFVERGTPAAIYNGGLLQTHLFYHDPLRRRPGLPEHVAALVEGLGHGHADLHLVNTDPVEGRSVLLQAGAFGEHRFESVTDKGDTRVLDGDGRYLRLDLGPGAQTRLHLKIRRFAHTPAYRPAPYDAG